VHFGKNECNLNQNYITINRFFCYTLLLNSPGNRTYYAGSLSSLGCIHFSLGHIKHRIKPAHIKIVITLVAFSYIEPFLMKHLFLVFAVFEPFKDPRVDTIAPKLLFIALNLAAMGLGVWKVSSTNMVF